MQSFVQAERRVHSPDLHEFVHRHIPVPNIQDEYRRKLFFLVNVTDGQVDPSSGGDADARLSNVTAGEEGGEGEEAVAARRASTSGKRKKKEEEERWEKRPPRWIPPLLWWKVWSTWTTVWSLVFLSPAASRRAGSEAGTPLLSHATAYGSAEETHRHPTRHEGPEDENEPPQKKKERPHDDPIPQELRLLVSTLPHTLSPYASVAILRDVLSKSAGGNARYTYVCRAALDLQLPISTTRSRVATAMNMWSFLRTQSAKLPYHQWLLMQKRCLINLPLSYILSSYWVVISWSGVVLLVALHFFGMDYESKVLATSCQGDFGLPEELMVQGPHLARPRGEEEVVQEGEEEDGDAASFGHSSFSSAVEGSGVEEGAVVVPSPPALPPEAVTPASPTPDRLPWRPASGLLPLLSSLLGSDRGALKATLYVLHPQCSLPGSSSSWREEEEEAEPAANEYRRAMYLVKQISAALRFPFFVDIEKLWTLELLEARVAERMRRVSSNHTWFWLRPVVRFFPLGLRKTEENLISSTCLRADRQYKRVTFIVYIHDHVPVTYAWLVQLRQHSCLSRSANVVVVAHPQSLRRGGVGKAEMEALKREAQYDVQYPAWSEGGGGGGESERKSGRRRKRIREEVGYGRGEPAPSPSSLSSPSACEEKHEEEKEAETKTKKRRRWHWGNDASRRANAEEKSSDWFAFFHPLSFLGKRTPWKALSYPAAETAETTRGGGVVDIALPLSPSTPPSSAARSGEVEKEDEEGGRRGVVWRAARSTILFPSSRPPYPSFNPAFQSFISSPTFISSFHTSHTPPLGTTTPSSSSSSSSTPP